MKKIVLVALVVVGAASLLWRHSDAPAERVLFDRIWLDHQPANDRDMIQVLAVLREDAIGVFQATSQWKGEHELFKVTPRGEGKIDIFYPQTQKTETVTYKAGACGGGDYEYCLEVRGASRGVKNYVSRKGWEIGSRAELLRLPPQL